MGGDGWVDHGAKAITTKDRSEGEEGEEDELKDDMRRHEYGRN